MPYGAVTFSNPSDLLYGITTSAERSMKVMNSLATALTSEYVLDLQILPYCPCQELLQPSNQTIFVLDLVHQGLVGKYNNQITDVVLCCGQTNITFDINKTIDYDNIQSISASYLPENCPDTFVTKYVNDCTLLRLCSPNYNGLFEMNLAKNGGSISNFNVDLTLRPYNPYIHVNPNFNNLYGQDWNDIRGLVCNGDFSIGILNDAWNVYEIQNRNYQNIFDRQIQNLDYNNRINRMESAAQMVAGLVQGAAIGGAAGSVGGKMMGGGSASASAAGAGAGALIGGTLSGLAGTVDMMNLLGRQQEGRNLAIDNFNLQLGNVRALPQSITKTSALTANNKLFPFVEIYECTDVERDAYFNKLKYDGFTLGFITHSFNSFRSSDSSNYFKGQLIRNTAIKGSTHEVNELANELNKGVYI